MNLEAIVTNYPYRKNLPKEDIAKGELPKKDGNFSSTWFCYFIFLVNVHFYIQVDCTNKCCMNCTCNRTSNTAGSY